MGDSYQHLHLRDSLYGYDIYGHSGVFRSSNDQHSLFPIRDRVTARMEFEQYFLEHVLERPFISPVSSVQHILHVGCGTGRWMRELSRCYPQAQVYGFDEMDATTRVCLVSESCHVAIGHLLEPFCLASSSFDLVYERFLAPVLPRAHWQVHVDEMARVCRSGGWVEAVELELPFAPTGPGCDLVISWMEQASQAHELDLHVTSHLPTLFTRAGLRRVQSRVLHLPLGSWGGTPGPAFSGERAVGLGGYGV